MTDDSTTKVQAPNSDAPNSNMGDIGAIAACSVIWGSTWYFITLQIGTVDLQVSIVYRFTLAAALLALAALIRGERLALSPAQHGAVAAMGLFAFAINYTFVYLAETRVASAVVAVMFASLAFVNLIVFRLFTGQGATRGVWLAAALGVVGVAALLWEELRTAHFDARAATGVAFAFCGVVCAAIANVCAARGERLGIAVLPLTAWAMGYGAAVLAVVVTVRGAHWTFEPTFAYIGSLLYLSVFGSVIAFALFFGLARRRGFTLASYIGALTPPIAMAMSSVFEDKTWTPLALVGIAVVVAGQVLLMRVRRT